MTGNLWIHRYGICQFECNKSEGNQLGKQCVILILICTKVSRWTKRWIFRSSIYLWLWQTNIGETNISVYVTSTWYFQVLRIYCRKFDHLLIIKYEIFLANKSSALNLKSLWPNVKFSQLYILFCWFCIFSCQKSLKVSVQ